MNWTKFKKLIEEYRKMIPVRKYNQLNEAKKGHKLRCLVIDPEDDYSEIQIYIGADENNRVPDWNIGLSEEDGCTNIEILEETQWLIPTLNVIFSDYDYCEDSEHMFILDFKKAIRLLACSDSYVKF